MKFLLARVRLLDIFQKYFRLVEMCGFNKIPPLCPYLHPYNFSFHDNLSGTWPNDMLSRNYSATNVTMYLLETPPIVHISFLSKKNSQPNLSVFQVSPWSLDNWTDRSTTDRHPTNANFPSLVDFAVCPVTTEILTCSMWKSENLQGAVSCGLWRYCRSKNHHKCQIVVLGRLKLTSMPNRCT